MSSYKTTGIILRRREYQEADRIYTILTPERKISAIAKGVRRAKAKLASHLELFGEIELMLIAGKRLDTITSARLVTPNDLAQDYERLRRGFLFLEMIDRLTDTEGVEASYDLLAGHLNILTKARPDLCELSFKLHLLELLGSLPDLSTPEPMPELIGLDIEQGRLVDGTAPSAAPLSKEAVTLWRLLLVRSFVQVERVKGVEAQVPQSLRVLNAFIEHQFGLRFKSAEI